MTISNLSMDSTSSQAAWVEHWQRAAPVLAKVRRDELGNMSDEDTARAFQSLAGFVASLPNRVPRTTSGFVEQQRLFMKLRKA